MSPAAAIGFWASQFRKNDATQQTCSFAIHTLMVSDRRLKIFSNIVLLCDMVHCFNVLRIFSDVFTFR